MSTDTVLDRINDIVEKHINKEFEQVFACRDIGLDTRCGMVYVSEDAIAVDKHRDGTLQYYGGFEFVDKDFRKEIGDYVFYLYDDSRVAEHIDRFFESKEAA
jgi:hypothetical protein